MTPQQWAARRGGEGDSVCVCVCVHQVHGEIQTKQKWKQTKFHTTYCKCRVL